MMELTRMKDKFNLIGCNALFTAFETQDAPWAEETPQSSNLAWLYWSHSRNKILNEMVAESDSAMSTYAEIILQMYRDKWDHIWDLYVAEYNPIENYNMVESGGDTNIKTGSLDRSGAITRTGSLDRSGAITKSGSESVSDDITYSGKAATTRSGNIVDTGLKADNETQNDSKIYGYNSSTGVNANSDVQQASHKNTQTFNDVKDETSFTNRTDSRDITTTFTDRADTDSRKDTYNNIADTDTRKDTYNNITDTKTHNLERSGNIGTMTTQMMIESEIAFRRNLFFEMIFSDIDHILTIPIY